MRMKIEMMIFGSFVASLLRHLPYRGGGVSAWRPTTTIATNHLHRLGRTTAAAATTTTTGGGGLGFIPDSRRTFFYQATTNPNLLKRRSSWNDDDDNDNEYNDYNEWSNGGQNRIIRKRRGGGSVGGGGGGGGGWRDDDNDEGGGSYRSSYRDNNNPVRLERGPPRNDFDRSGGRGRRGGGREWRNNNNRDRDRGGDWQRRGGGGGSSGSRRFEERGGGGGRRRNNNDGWDRRNTNSNDKQWRRGGGGGGGGGRKRGEDSTASKIDMKGLEAEGFVHLYGIAPVLSALKANQRDFNPRQSQEEILNERFGVSDDDNDDDYYDDDDDDDDDIFNDFSEEEDQTTTATTTKKPEAQYTPWLFIQDRTGGGESGRSGDKIAAAAEIKQLAQDLGIPIAYSDKGTMNSLSGNRPHQGFVLRCGALEFKPLSRIPPPDPEAEPSMPNLWLVLDEVVDPQNLGALLRSSFFLGGGGGNNNHHGTKKRVGVLVCSKNSAPPTPVVSAASAGAMELLDIYSTNSLPRTLSSAADDGFRIIGAASNKPRALEEDDSVQIYDLQNLPSDDERPTLLVLGSEGHGLRTLVAKQCTDFVRIPRGDSNINPDDDEEGGSRSTSTVDSLNVSVTGGILLWHLLYGSPTS